MRIRNMAIIAVLFDSWVRVSELIDIRLDDLERIDGKLSGIFQVRTKAKSNSGIRHFEDKEISPNGSLGMLTAWLEERDNYALANDPYLFVSQVQTNRDTGEYISGGTKMTRHTVQAMLNRLGVAIWKEENPEEAEALKKQYSNGELNWKDYQKAQYVRRFKVSPHDMRRGGATYGYEHQGLDLFDIQEGLGDESLDVHADTLHVGALQSDRLTDGEMYEYERTTGER